MLLNLWEQRCYELLSLLILLMEFIGGRDNPKNRQFISNLSVALKCVLESCLPIDLSAVCFRIMRKRTCIPHLVPFTVWLLPSSLHTFSLHPPHHRTFYGKWWRNIHRKLLWVIFLVAIPSTQEDPDSVIKLKGSLWRRKVLAIIFIFLRRKLIWVDEFRLPLTEKF